MSAFVIDTNVLVVANGGHEVSDDCLRRCLNALSNSREGIVVVDNQFQILKEYRKHAHDTGQPGVGDAFLKWLLRNQANPDHCEQVPLTASGLGNYLEFPSDPALDGFDKSDRKFVAVALTSEHGPEIQNAVDTDWWKFRDEFVIMVSRYTFYARGRCSLE
ncbi:MAG: hypothetical protein M3Y56_11975 [Armatimonadota bacterium]|nr:hypothetical protein [Armatimonadota bacterium]